MAAFIFALFYFLSYADCFQFVTDESIIEDCKAKVARISLNPKNVTNKWWNSCCKIMLDEFNSTEKDVLNYKMFKEAFLTNGLPDPGQEQYGYYKVYACKYGINSLNESSMFLAPFIRSVHAKLIWKYKCKSRENCKYKLNDSNILSPELWIYSISAWTKPSYNISESGRFGGLIKYLLENKGCSHLDEVLEIYRKIRLLFGFSEEKDSYGCKRQSVL